MDSDSDLRGELTSIRSATTDDADLLVDWHADPDVARYWDGETFTREQMLHRLERPDVDSYLVLEDDKPVGYLQVWYGDESRNEGGLDMFLVPEARDRGLGPDAARTMARWLVDSERLRGLTVDPYLSNARAVAAWKKAGFHPLKSEPRTKNTLLPGC